MIVIIIQQIFLKKMNCGVVMSENNEITLSLKRKDAVQITLLLESVRTAIRTNSLYYIDGFFTENRIKELEDVLDMQILGGVYKGLTFIKASNV